MLPIKNLIQNDTNTSYESVAGAVIIYNSGNEVIENINTYLDQINRLYVVDNSDVPNVDLINYFQSIPSIYYISTIGNPGIAYALNVAARQAIHDGFTYLLTMDDDSKAPADMIKKMIFFLENNLYKERIGIVSVAHSKPSKLSSYKQVDFTMTSGNLLNLNAYKEVGPFNNDLFIDQVDHEYNLRLQLKGFRIIELANLKLIHNLGTVKEISLFNKRIRYISHSPIRLYYVTRNTVYIVREHFVRKPKFCLTILWLGTKELIKSSVLEDQKRLRMSYFWRAIRAGWKGNLGKLTN